MFGLAQLLSLLSPAAILKFHTQWLLSLHTHYYTYMLTGTAALPLAAIWEHIWSPFWCWSRYCSDTAMGDTSPSTFSTKPAVWIFAAKTCANHHQACSELHMGEDEEWLWRCLWKVWGFLNTGKLQCFGAGGMFKANRGECGSCWRLLITTRPRSLGFF